MNATMPEQEKEFEAAELGAMLRETRENLGQDLETVAQDLRIRRGYIEAIEDGRLEDLPGSVYASGFLRGYSDYLGLDGEKIVRRFRMAGSKISNKTRLQMPSPVEDGRLPNASILLIAALIAVGSYGGWYYLSSSSEQSFNMVNKVPRALSGLEKKSLPDQAAPSPSRQTESAPLAQTLQTETADDASEMTATEPEEKTTLRVTSTPPVAESSASRTLPVDSPKTVSIVVRAITDSWVAVKTEDNEKIFSGLMRPGKSYEVPAKAGLLLETGNAGGLQITVGGEPVPPLGKIGEVRRNIPLNARSLLSGSN
ncbi:MAG: RodZ domain-containing protein [Pseudomonadota bacterium]|nr:RodZ domain-containing protein [Pseudomonadota bacterium]